MVFQFESDKSELYKNVRDASGKTLRPKEIRQFDKEFLAFSAADPSMSVLELGCGAGLLLQYLKHKGFKDVTGIDYDENLTGVLSELDGDGVATEISDAEAYLDRIQGARVFDRIVIFDVLEHFDLDSSVRILSKVRSVLAEGGKVLIRVPNSTSPWGLRMQFGTFDHVTMFSPGRLYELAKITGFEATAMAGHTIGKRRKVFFERLLHGILSRILTYHPEIWEAALVCIYEKTER